MAVIMSPVMESAHPTEFTEAVDILKLAHQQLTGELSILYRMARAFVAVEAQEIVPVGFEQLRNRAMDFLTNLDRHFEWEKKELLPMLGGYAGQEEGPTLKPTIWAVAQDYSLAKQYLDEFLKVCIQSQEGFNQEEAISCLLQGCLALFEHFRLEQEVVLPLADQMLTDIDYLFS